MLLLVALLVGSTSVWGVDETVTTMATSGNGTNFSWTTAQNTGASAPALNSSRIRLYASNSITFTAKNGKKFQTIKLTTGRNTHIWSSATSSPTGFDGTDTWTASDETTTSVTITNNNTGSGNLQISQFDITYVSEGGGGIAKPTFSDTGAVVAGTKVTLTHADADEIRYTTDGTDPTKTTGNIYSTPIEITSPITIKAIAVKDDDVSDVATVNYTISVAEPTFNLATGSYLEGCTFTLTSAGNKIYYNMTTNGSNPSNPTSSSTLYTGPISLSSGSNKIKAIAIDNYGNSSNIVSRTYTGVEPVTLPFGWDNGTTRATVNSLTGVIQTGLDSDYSDDNHKLKFNGDNDNIVFFLDEKPAKMMMSVKMIGGGKTSKFSIQESTNGAEFTEVEQLTISGSEKDVVNLETTQNFTATTRVVKINFIKGDNVGLGSLSITAEPATITINAACTDGEGKYYGTYSNNKAFVVPADLTVSAVGISDGKLDVTKYETGDIVKANTGVMVSATSAGDKTVTLSSETGTEKAGNLLKASGGAGIEAAAMAAASASETKFYRLTMHNGTDLGFYWGAAEGAAFDLAANKAYLAVPPGTPINDANFLSFVFGDEEQGETDGINAVSTKVENGVRYNLAGQKVGADYKGIIVVNGKKYLNK